MEYLRLTDLKDVPALLRWVDVCERNGLMSSITAAQWRLRIEARDGKVLAAGKTKSPPGRD